MKVVLFDLGNTLEDQDADVLLPGALETLQAIQAMRAPGGEAAALALVSGFDMPDNPDELLIIRQRYFEILDKLGIRSFFEPVEERVRLSSEAGVFKPDEKIFRAAIEKIDESLRFRDVVFITENKGHVIAARHLGMSAIHFKGPEQATEDVDRLVELIPLVQNFLEASN
jgi:FMN phosphatase YigB (HAD superfamily)